MCIGLERLSNLRYALVVCLFQPEQDLSRLELFGPICHVLECCSLRFHVESNFLQLSKVAMLMEFCNEGFHVHELSFKFDLLLLHLVLLSVSVLFNVRENLLNLVLNLASPPV